jgi:hypothetical protein
MLNYLHHERDEKRRENLKKNKRKKSEETRE